MKSESDILRKRSMTESTEIFYCQICTETKRKVQAPFYFGSCKHIDACLDCYRSIIQSQVKSNKTIRGINCPHDNCKVHLQEHSRLLELFPYQLKKQIKQLFAKQGHNDRCRTIDCKGVIYFGYCDSCGVYFCQNCFKPVHQETPCEISMIQLPENIQKCPKCHQGIEKVEGCVEMTCIRCFHSFCFKCLANWDRSHHFSCGNAKEIGCLPFYRLKQFFGIKD